MATQAMTSQPQMALSLAPANWRILQLFITSSERHVSALLNTGILCGTAFSLVDSDRATLSTKWPVYVRVSANLCISP